MSSCRLSSVRSRASTSPVQPSNVPTAGVYYHVLRGQVKGTSPGDKVAVWFTAKHAKSDRFTYSVPNLSIRCGRKDKKRNEFNHDF